MHSESSNYYSIIAGHIRSDHELDVRCKYLHGEIAALCKKEGYCWATNQYFSEACGVTPRTIQRWLIQLQKKEYIIIDIDRSNYTEQRKIWVSRDAKYFFEKNKEYNELKESLGCDTDVMGGGTTRMSYRYDMDVAHSIKDIKSIKENILTDRKESSAEASHLIQKTSSFVSHGKYVKLSLEEYDILCKDHGKEIIDEQISSINDYLSSTGKKPYKDYAATIRNWVRRNKRNTGKPSSFVPFDPIARHKGLNKDMRPRDTVAKGDMDCSDWEPSKEDIEKVKRLREESRNR